MKKIFMLFIVAGMFSFLACGPSAEEKAAAEKARQDSINAVIEKAKADSIAAVEQARADSMAAAEQARQDSIAAAEAAKASKPKTSAPKPKVEEPKKTENKSRPGATKVK
ncbi:MAG TPA: hypothetical protein P5531_10965 [Bacteroidales bacterium]|nr:hypothetical protein [Bacteroidales bacterium]HSA44083.1 hypothetical protein [Bacteroidales bacterium]